MEVKASSQDGLRTSSGERRRPWSNRHVGLAESGRPVLSSEYSVYFRIQRLAMVVIFIANSDDSAQRSVIASQAPVKTAKRRQD
jgi:hypothetical protein